ncbi:hypothetical protein WAI453_008600 [Rhynchosporium graminicola]|uniref:Uncharacterized protein n=1 Tax=Rhynchosporium graminicola TaxID=2792576 RepID=A0A1E1KHA5_9HELO|nr:uncharacterized protein RCO7_00253 [Rhynchosporium commune]
MEFLSQDIFYECSTPTEPPSSYTNWFSLRLSLPLPLISFFRRKIGSGPGTAKTSLHHDQDSHSHVTNHSNVDNAAPPQLPEVPSVMEVACTGHMINYNLPFVPQTPPSTPPQGSRPVFDCSYEEDEYDSTLSTPPLSPSSSRSTSTATTWLSEPSTPTRNSGIEPHCFPISPLSEFSSPSIKPNDICHLLANQKSEWNDTGITSSQITTIPSQESTRKQSSSNKTTKKQKQKQKNRPKYPFHVLETGPFIPEGLHLVQFPASSMIIAPDTLEAGHIIGYGSRAVQSSAFKIARERRQIMRNKARHYGMGDTLKTVGLHGSTS